MASAGQVKTAGEQLEEEWRGTSAEGRWGWCESESRAHSHSQVRPVYRGW